MADLKLKKVTLRNWGKFTKANLEFPDSGLVMVTGLNLSSGGAMQSVGSGKTMFGESFSRALLGIRGRYEYLKKFSRDRKGDTYVCVEATLLGKPLKVELGFQCEEINPRAEGLRFSYDGSKAIERGTVAQTRAELSKLIGVPPLLSMWTVFVNGKRMDFTQLSQEDSVNLVMSALRQPPWNDYHENVKAYVRRFNKLLVKDETTHEHASNRVKEATDDATEAQTQVDTAQADYDEAKADYDNGIKELNEAQDSLSQKMTTLKGRQKELTKEMKGLEESKAADHHNLEIQQRDYQEDMRQLREEIKPLTTAQTAAQRVATTAETNLNNYQNAKRTCPTCKRPMGDALDPAHVDKLQKDYDEAATKQEKAEAAYARMYKKMDVLNEQLGVVSTNINLLGVKYGITTLSQEYEHNDTTITEYVDGYNENERLLAKLGTGPAKAVINAAKTKLEERQRVLKKAQEELQAASEALAVSQATDRVLNYWNTAFSPYGIPNMVLREAIAPLNHEARRVSASMTGGTIEVVYSTTRETSTGATQARLNIEVNNLLGCSDLEGSSNGEAGLTNYIISETLSNLGQVSRRIGYRWYDEIVPHQDAKVCHSIYSYWKELAQKLGILIMMVDHNPVAANYADYFLTIEKKGKPGEVVGNVYWKNS